MTDRFGRTIEYLRISLTDLCNLRCVYCMPAEGVGKLRHGQILSIEEICEIAEAAVALGIRKIRLTGGEPLVRRGVVELVRMLKALPGLQELALTTNGLLLPELAGPLKEAGLDRVNISLDTLDAEKYRRLTRIGSLEQALAGIRAAREAGLSPIKLNAVLIGGVNDDEIPALAELTRTQPIEMRFIELMPIGDAEVFGPEAYLPADEVLRRLPELEPLPAVRGSVARRYRLPGAVGTVGLISPVSCSFCGECNRIRLTADGHMKPCLHAAKEFPLRGLHGEELKEAIRAAVNAKPEAHGTLDAAQRSEAGRNMNEIGG